MAGEIQSTTWREVGVGNIVRTPDLHMHSVVQEKQGWLLLERLGRKGEGLETTPIPKHKQLDEPVEIYVPSEEECLNLLEKELGARMLREIEDREQTLSRRLNWRVEPVAASAKAMQTHIDMIHGVNVDDVLRKWQGTDVNPASKEQKRKSLAELRQAHDEMHADPDLWPMPFPHIHTLEAP